MFHDPTQRTTAISIWFMSFMAGSAVGPLIGGALLEVAWWGSTFLIGIVTTIVTPVVGRRIGPGTRTALGLAVAALGLLLVGRADDDSGVGYVVVGLVLLFGGIMPVLALGVDIVVAAAPPERTGAASAITETAQELGIALGIAVLGSIATAVYRHQMRDAVLPEAVPVQAAEAARSTLGAADEVADQLGPGLWESAGRALGGPSPMACRWPPSVAR